MWYAGSKDLPSAAAPRSNGAGPPRGAAPRSQSQTNLRPRGGGGESLGGLAGGRQRRAGAVGDSAWQRGSALRGAGAVAGGGASGRSLGKSASVTAAALLSLGGSGEFGDAAAEAAQAKELLRVGPWSVRRAPGGPDAGLIYVNVESGRAHREPPEEVLAELGLGSDAEEGERSAEDGSDGATDPGFRQTGGSCSSRAGGGDNGVGGRSRPSTGAGSPATTMQQPKFRRILLGNSREMPLAMARDIRAALVEDSSLFDAVRQRFSDAPQDEGPLDFDSLPDDLDSAVLALAPGEVSDVLGTDSGIQILLRIS